MFFIPAAAQVRSVIGPPASVETLRQQALSVKAGLYRLKIRELEKDGYNLQLRFDGRASWYQYKDIDDLLNFQFEKVSTFNLSSKLESSIPIKKWNDWFAEPHLTVSGLWDFTVGRFEPAGSATARLAYKGPGEYRDLRLGFNATYGTRFAEETLAIDDYGYIGADLEFTVDLGLNSGKHRWVVYPGCGMSYYIDTLHIASPDGEPFTVRQQYEIGIILTTEPRIRIWKFNAPRLRLRYRFGGDAQGISIGF